MVIRLCCKCPTTDVFPEHTKTAIQLHPPYATHHQVQQLAEPRLPVSSLLRSLLFPLTPNYQRTNWTSWCSALFRPAPLSLENIFSPRSCFHDPVLTRPWLLLTSGPSHLLWISELELITDRRLTTGLSASSQWCDSNGRKCATKGTFFLFGCTLCHLQPSRDPSQWLRSWTNDIMAMGKLLVWIFWVNFMSFVRISRLKALAVMSQRCFITSRFPILFTPLYMVLRPKQHCWLQK